MLHPYLMLVVAVLVFTVQNIAFKAFNTRYMKGLSSYFLFQILHFGVVTALLLLFNGGLRDIDAFTAVSACVWGVLFVTMLLTYMKAMGSGPLSFTTLFLSSAVLIPIVWGVIFWGESVTAIQIAGLAVLLFTYYLGAAKGGGAFSPKWALFVLISFALNGALICISKQQQFVMRGAQVYEFLIIGFAVAFAVCVLGFAYTRLMHGRLRAEKGAPQREALPSGPRFFAIAGVAGVVTAVGNALVMLMTTRLPSVVQFPVTMGGMVIFTTLVSVIHFKEHISRRGVAALALGLASLVMLSL